MVQKAIREYHEKPALRAYIEIFLTLLTISLFGIFAIRPTVKTIGVLLKEIEAKQSTIKTMDEKIANLNSAKNLYMNEKEKIQLVKEAIPQKPEPDVLALQITELSKSVGVDITSMSLEGVTIIGVPAEEDNILSFSLSVRGNYQQLLDFARRLEELRRPVKFDSISLSSEEEKDVRAIRLDFSGLKTPYLSK